MTRSGEGSRGRYARAVEDALARLRGRPGVLSPRDWTLVADWHARGIPLATVLDVVEEAARRRARGEARPRSLGYVAPAVEEAWEAQRSGRAPSPVSGDEARRSLEDASDCWRAIARSEEASPLGQLLGGLLDRLAAGEDPSELDRLVDESIAHLAPGERVEAARSEVEARLAQYRGRMSGPVFEDTRRRAIADRLRREIGLPRLAWSRRRESSEAS